MPARRIEHKRISRQHEPLYLQSRFAGWQQHPYENGESYFKIEFKNWSMKSMVYPTGGRTMAEIICKRCQAADYVKNGIVRGLQRYHCRQCACNFTATAPRGKPAAMKALALLLYAMGNMSLCGIGRRLKVSDVRILRWV
jgi:transposase-like protein